LSGQAFVPWAIREGQTSVCKSEYFVADLEALLGLVAQALDDTGELDTQRLGGPGREGIVSFALHEIHTVETEGFDFDNGLSTSCRWLGGLGVNEECIGWPDPILDIWNSVSSDPSICNSK
jgi:hypothetical protein